MTEIRIIVCAKEIPDPEAPLSDVSHWLLIAVGFDILYFLVALVTFEYVIED